MHPPYLTAATCWCKMICRHHNPPSSSSRIAGIYFSAEAVLTSTTRSPGRIIPRSASSGSAARVAAPSGDQAVRRSRHSSRIVSRIASSVDRQGAAAGLADDSKNVDMPEILRHVQPGRDRLPGRFRLDVGCALVKSPHDGCGWPCTERKSSAAAPGRPSPVPRARQTPSPSRPPPSPRRSDRRSRLVACQRPFASSRRRPARPSRGPASFFLPCRQPGSWKVATLK